MPAELLDYSDDVLAVVYVRVPGWLRNAVKCAAVGAGVSLNSWVSAVLLAPIVTGKQIGRAHV